MKRDYKKLAQESPAELLQPGDRVKPGDMYTGTTPMEGEVTEVTPDGKATVMFPDKDVEYSADALSAGEIQRVASGIDGLPRTPSDKPRAPAGMQTDQETGEVTESDEETPAMKGELPVASGGLRLYRKANSSFNVVFPNMEMRDYSKRPYFIHDWFKKVRLAATRNGGFVVTKYNDKLVEAEFRTVEAARRFAGVVCKEFNVPKKRMKGTRVANLQELVSGDEVMYMGEMEVGLFPWEGKVVEVYDDSALIEALPGEDVPEGHREVLKFDQLEKLSKVQPMTKKALMDMEEGDVVKVAGRETTLRRKSGKRGMVQVQEGRHAPIWVALDEVEAPARQKTASAADDQWLSDLDFEADSKPGLPVRTGTVETQSGVEDLKRLVDAYHDSRGTEDYYKSATDVKVEGDKVVVDFGVVDRDGVFDSPAELKDNGDGTFTVDKDWWFSDDQTGEVLARAGDVFTPQGLIDRWNEGAPIIEEDKWA